MVDIKVPELGESIQEVQIAQWLKREGEWVAKDEEIVEVESEKASQSLSAPASGIIHKILFGDGQFAKVGDVIAHLTISAAPAGAAGNAPAAAGSSGPSNASPSAPAGSGRASAVMPAAQHALHEHQLSAEEVSATGPGGRLLKEDVLRAAAERRRAAGERDAPPATPVEGPAPSAPRPIVPPPPPSADSPAAWPDDARVESTAPMSMIRRTIAARLVEAQRTAALLTTFNEIDMQPVIELRKRYQEAFTQKHGVKLGFMSFFAKASVEALRRFPAINSEIRGHEVVSRNYHDIGIAIGGGKGLVVPILRSVQRMSFADVERRIAEFAALAQKNQLNPGDLEGGTFTISNGGIYGSLLSTPIVNPPQSGILGLHAIQDRPVAIAGQVAIRPMMYVALTYDHRIVDGREAVGFLRTIKDVLEEPARLFLEV